MKFGRRGARIVSLAGGGVGHVAGGVGTLMLYLIDAWAGRDDMPPIRVIDTRGRGGILGGVGFFAKALCIVLWMGLTGRLALLHAHMTTRGSVARKCIMCLLATMLGRPTIVHMHGADFFPFYNGLRPVYRRLISAVLRRARFVIVLGEAWRQFLIETVGIPAEKVAIVMNGVPRPAAPSRFRDANGPARILFLGRLGDRKGVPELIAALAAPELRARDWVATIAGDGDLPRFRDAVAQLDFGDRVRLTGWVDREGTQALLADADILVLPSRHEAMPMAVIEAMAHRVAVVTTPVGVIPELLRDGESALLVPPGAPADLARALARLIDDPPLRRRLAAAGNDVFMEKLEVTAVAERVVELYRTAVAGDAGEAGETGDPANPVGSANACFPGRPPLGRRAGDGVSGSASDVRRLLDRIEPIRRTSEARSMLARLTAARKTSVVSFVNKHAINVAWRDPGFASLLAGADLLLRDGVGVGLCMRLLGNDPGLNMNGTDFIPVLAAAYAGRRVGLYGTRQPWLNGAAAALRKLGCDLVEVIDGFQPDETYARAAAATRPDLLILAMGIPKQERVAALIARRVDAPMVIVNGGAICDFLGGRFPRAPRWMRSIGLEWAFRLCREPTRLWRRYVTGGVLFVARMARLRMMGGTRARPVQVARRTP